MFNKINLSKYKNIKSFKHNSLLKLSNFSYISNLFIKNTRNVKSGIIAKNNRHYSSYLENKKSPIISNNFIKIYSTHQEFNKLYENLYFTMHDVFFFKLWKDITMHTSLLLILPPECYKIMILVLNLFLYRGEGCVYVVDNEENEKKLMECLGQYFQDMVVKINNLSEMKQFEIYNRSIIIMNYKEFKIDCNFDYIPEKKIFNFIFFDIETNKNFLKWLESFKSFINKKANRSIVLNSSIKDLNLIQDILDIHFKNVSYLSSEIPLIKSLNTNHYGMIVNKQNYMIVAAECAKKYLKLNKTVLVICETQKYLEEVTNQLLNFKNSNLSVRLNTEIKNTKTQYDIIIEAPFLNFDEFIFRKVNFLKINQWETSTFISLIFANDSKLIDEIRQKDLIKIKIKNLLSSAFLADDSSRVNFEKLLQSALEDMLKGENESKKLIEDQQEEKPEFYNNLSKFIISRKDNFNYPFDKYYDTIKDNPKILKLICQIFFEQNMKEILSNKNEFISILTGEPGYVTFKMQCLNNQQIEERYNITKILIRYGLVESKNYEQKIQRIFNSFQFVFDVKINQISQFRAICEQENIKVEPISEKPIIFYHQFYEAIYDQK